LTLTDTLIYLYTYRIYFLNDVYKGLFHNLQLVIIGQTDTFKPWLSSVEL